MQGEARRGPWGGRRRGSAATWGRRAPALTTCSLGSEICGDRAQLLTAKKLNLK